MTFKNFTVAALLMVQPLALAAKHDPSKCLENGKYDNDCCAIRGTESCKDSYLKTMGNNVCYDGGSWKAYSYTCEKTDKADK